MRLYPENPILLIDDEEQFLISAKLTLRSAGINNIVTCSDSRQVADILAEGDFSLIIMDLVMPHVTGEELVPAVVQSYPSIPLIVMTAMNKVEIAVNCMREGAFDYIVKPADSTRLVNAIRRALELREVQNENVLLKQYLLSGKLRHPEAFEEIITNNDGMRAIFQYIEAVAGSPLPVLVTGETGAGKEKIASVIHRLSGRSGQLVSINVAGLDDNLFSDTLFGHRRGAYTGALENRRGLIEQAGDGTIFLDEIGDLSLESQVKLLRLLQEGKFFPLGSDAARVSNARVVVATNRDLQEMQQDGSFRRDLYYRLKTHHVDIPPLRERLKDLPLLVGHFLDKASSELGKKRPTAPRELITLLQTYQFPGNIRELEGMIYDAVSQHQSGILSMETFRSKLSAAMVSKIRSSEEISIGKDGKTVTFSDSLPGIKELEQLLIEEALQRAGGNQTIAAELIGMTRKALNNRLIRSRKQ